MNFSEWAQAVKERDGWECQECGTTDNLHAHHIKPRALGGKNVLSNGVALCGTHHRARHVGELAPRAISSRGKPESITKGISAPAEWWDKVDAAAERHSFGRSNLIRAFVEAYLEEQTTGSLSPMKARLVRNLAS